MSKIFCTDAYTWLRRALGATEHSLTVTRMAGSTSSSLFRIEHADQRFVLRVLDNREWLADEPDLAAHEAAALTAARRAGLPTPELVAYADGDVGFGAPVVLTSFLPGTVELRPADFRSWMAELAGQLAAIHRHTAEDFPWHFRSWVNRAALARLWPGLHPSTRDIPTGRRLSGLGGQADRLTRSYEPGICEMPGSQPLNALLLPVLRDALSQVTPPIPVVIPVLPAAAWVGTPLVAAHPTNARG